jgi:hypothetical protein
VKRGLLIAMVLGCGKAPSPVADAGPPPLPVVVAVPSTSSAPPVIVEAGPPPPPAPAADFMTYEALNRGPDYTQIRKTAIFRARPVPEESWGRTALVLPCEDIGKGYNGRIVMESRSRVILEELSDAHLARIKGIPPSARGADCPRLHVRVGGGGGSFWVKLIDIVDP